MSGRLSAATGIDQHVQYLTDGPLPADGLTQRQMLLDLVAVPTAVLFLDDVARFNQVSDDRVGAALGDAGSKTVRGAISATGGKGAVLVGGSGLGAVSCPANTIDGAVTFDANKADVQLAHSSVAGAVTASANLAGTTLSGNQIGGALTCTTNNPAPTNAGVSNVVGGNRSGQTCASLLF